MSETVRLSSFELRDRLAEGGMGMVYRGVHRETDVPVAVKFNFETTDVESLRRFRTEVQAHAALHHPGIVHLFEYGTVGEQAARRLDERIPAGSPFVAMEYAQEGALRARMPISGWKTLHSILVQVLDGLAHAHARSVIHRDLKPENLLVFESSDDSNPLHVKLADFGIAHVLEPETGEKDIRLSARAGTPAYMAPEQFRGRWRRYGPWTDLYALGCVTWELVCGEPPFAGEDPHAVALRHESATRSPFEPQYPVPEGLEAWIRRAMASAPEHRFQRVADAARALPARDDWSDEATDDDDERVASRRARSPVPLTPTLEKTRIFDRETLARGPTLPLGDHVSGRPTPKRETADGFEASPEPPPVPESWRRRRTEPLPSPLVGTGLGLFGLRETPFVDRDAERNEMWGALREVERSGGPRVVVVVGGAGAGKSRLVQWMARRSHELGAARVMRAVHTAGGGDPSEGLGAMVRRLVQGYQLGRAALHEHLLEVLPTLEDDPVGRESDARALTELVYPTDGMAESVDGPPYRFASPAQKVALVARTIRRYAQRRRAFVWFDDIQWGRGAVRVVSHLLEHPSRAPAALVPVTLRADILAERPALRELLDDWTSQERCTRIDLEPLEADDHRRFVDRMLPLDDALVDRVAGRTEGNPLFASQLLQALVEGEDLEACAEGFAIPEGESLELPRDVHELWMRRLERWAQDLVDGETEPLWRAVEMAAALGREVDRGEWHAVCRAVGADDPALLRATLIERGLAEGTSTGWAFAHGLLVECLGRSARVEGRWRAHHRRCVELLENLYPERTEQTAARRADHWVEADEPERALEPLLEEFQRLRQFGDWRRARDVLDRRQRILDSLGIGESDRRRLENDVHLDRCHHALGTSPETIVKSLETARWRALSLEDDELLATIWFAAAKVQRSRGEHREARGCARYAAEAARRCGDDFTFVGSSIERGWAEYLLGNMDGAEAQFTEAYQSAADIGDRFHELVARRGMAWPALARGDDERAAELFDSILEESRRAGYRSLEAVSLNGLGEIARHDGALDRARSCYRSFRALGRELHRPHSLAVAAMNISMVELKAGRIESAGEWIREQERRFDEMARSAMKRQVRHLIHLTHAAAVGDRTQFDSLREDHVSPWPADVSLEKDHPWLLETTGEYALETGWEEAAREVWRLAAELWGELGDEKAAERVAEQLET